MEELISMLTSRGIDIDAAMAYTGNEKNYHRALRRFVGAYEENSERVQRSFDNKDYEDYTMIVHSLKSNARMIGDNELGALAEKLQFAGQSGDTDIIEADTHRLLSDYKDLCDAIRPYLADD